MAQRSQPALVRFMTTGHRPCSAVSRAVHKVAAVNTEPQAHHLVVNWNSQELNQLALALARRGELAGLVRPYVNQGRAWERGLARLPLAAAWVAGSFGRRQLIDPALHGRIVEAGVLPDLLAALVARTGALGDSRRHRWTHALFEQVRRGVAAEAGRLAAGAACVVAYEGFALEAFRALQLAGQAGRAVLSYPVAHHRQRRLRRLQELEREPEFASTWPDFDDWPADHEARLDEEIDRADCVLLGSAHALDSFVQQGVAADKLKVVPYGVDLALFHPPVEPRPARPTFEAVFAGQLTQRKGLSYLLRGWQQFQRPGAQLTLIGAVVGDSTPLARHAAGCVHLPHQTRGQLAQHFRAADVLVFPTLVEGMPLVVLEAMACGLPIIATANGPGEIVRDGVDGFLIPECDADAVCDRLERLHRDRDLCAWMGRNAAARAREFSWDAYVAGVLRAIKPPPPR